MIGASFKTSIIGYIIIALDLLKLVGDAIKEQGMPTDLNGWIVFAAGLATGVGLILAKDYNVSNSSHPAAPTIVSDVVAATPNPSASREAKPEP